MCFSSSLLMENGWIGIVCLLIYTREKCGFEVEPIYQYSKLISSRVRKPHFSLTLWQGLMGNVMQHSLKIPMLRIWELNIILDPRLGMRFNSAESQLKIPETEEQRMLESEEDSSTDHRGWRYKSKAGVCMLASMGVGRDTCSDAHLTVYAATMRAMPRGLFEVQGFLLFSTFLVCECMCACVHIRYAYLHASASMWMQVYLCICVFVWVSACMSEWCIHDVGTHRFTLPLDSLKQSPVKPRVHSMTSHTSHLALGTSCLYLPGLELYVGHKAHSLFTWWSKFRCSHLNCK